MQQISAPPRALHAAEIRARHVPRSCPSAPAGGAVQHGPSASTRIEPRTRPPALRLARRFAPSAASSATRLVVSPRCAHHAPRAAQAASMGQQHLLRVGTAGTAGRGRSRAALPATKARTPLGRGMPVPALSAVRTSRAGARAPVRASALRRAAWHLSRGSGTSSRSIDREPGARARASHSVLLRVPQSRASAKRRVLPTSGVHASLSRASMLTTTARTAPQERIRDVEACRRGNAALVVQLREPRRSSRLPDRSTSLLREAVCLRAPRNAARCVDAFNWTVRGAFEL